MRHISRYLVLLLLMATLHADAKTIHWLTFVDTTDSNVGQIDIFGRETLYSRFIGVVNAALQDRGYKTDIHDIYGARRTPQACKNEIQNLQVSPEDIVVFYYIGHGGRSVDDKTQWPQMMFGDYDKDFIPLEWVHKSIKAKGPKLAVVIGMCCNSYVNNLSAKSMPAFTPNYGNTYMSQDEINRMADLFTNEEGDIILSSSTPGQTSGCLMLGNNVIDAFTACLVVNTQEMLKGNVPNNWKGFLDSVKKMVAVNTQSVHGSEQTVQYVPNLRPSSKATTPSKKETAEEARKDVGKQTPDTQKDSEDSSSSRDRAINYFNSVFNALIDTDIDDDRRIELVELFSEKNSDLMNVNVLTLSQDGNTVIGRQSLEDFVGRLATSHIMQGVSVSDISERGISVHEIFRR